MARKRAGSQRKTRTAGRHGHRRPRASPNDGGAWSLAGYVYQMVGSAVERVALMEAPGDDASETSARFFIEQYGQDALSTGAREACLIQFKYSQDARPIKPGELAEILLSLETSSKDLRRKGAVRWRLITNRKLSATAKKFHDAAVRVTGSKTRGGAGAGNDSEAVIRRLGGQLEEVVEKDLDQFNESLLDAAQRFGVDDEDIARRVMALLLDVATKHRDRREVSLKALNRALADYPNPRSIRLRDCQSTMREALASAVRAQGGITLSEAVEGRGIQSLLARRAALAIVCGPGGCGKTLSLFKTLDQRLSGAVGHAGMIVERPRSLRHILDSWRNAQPSSSGSSSEALHRLRVANPDAMRPVLVLGLDGLDEVRDTERAEAEELIRHFHKMHVELHSSKSEPDGLLIVTCRNKEDLDDIVAPRGTGGSAQPEIPWYKLEEFTYEEFAAVWAHWFPDEPVPRLGLPDEMFATLADQGNTATVLNPRLLALLHPVLLGCTKSLSTDERRRLYEGDAEMWHRVLDFYFAWFTRKASDRAGCTVKQAREIVKAVARATVGKSGACDRDVDWVTPATEHAGGTQYLVSQLFADAVTAGVVQIDGESKYILPIGTPIEWRWRFPELAAHLALLP